MTTPRFEEQIGVRLPGQALSMVTVRVTALESDEEVLSRISRQVGTIFNVVGTKYKVVSSEPFKLRRIGVSDGPKVTPAVGERWKPKDARRNNIFVIASVREDHVITEAGRKIQLARLSRYERVD